MSDTSNDAMGRPWRAPIRSSRMTRAGHSSEISL
jgi:hypothetical protein